MPFSTLPRGRSLAGRGAKNPADCAINAAADRIDMTPKM